METKVILFIMLPVAAIMKISSSTLLEKKYEELDKKFASLLQNITNLRSEMVTTDVLMKYLREEISFRGQLEKQVEELTTNNTLLQIQYESSEQEIIKLRIQVEGLTRVLEENIKDMNHNMSVLELLYGDDLQQTSALRTSQSTMQQELRRLSVDLAEERNKMNMSVSNAVETLQHVSDVIWMNLSKSISDIEILKQQREDVSFTVGLSDRKLNFDHQIVVYEVVLRNVGGGYDSNSGIFTSPAAGTYVFTWNSMTYNGNCRIFLNRNGLRFDVPAYSRGLNNESIESVTIVESLLKGDRVWVQTDKCSELYGGSYTYFTGFKI